MNVEEELARYALDNDTVLTIGVFDGVHLGHRHLISKLLDQAKRRHLLSGVITFYQHPEELLSRGVKMAFLTDISERIELLKIAGVDIIVPLSFTRELSMLSARQFTGFLQKYLRMRGLIIGPDFAMGRERKGNEETLRELGREMGFSVDVVPPLVIGGEVVSSTAIRRSLAEGDMEHVRKLYGRNFVLRGEVVSGAGRGAGLGFPTANLDVGPEQALLPDGVYAARAYINGKTYQAMANIGQCPTFGTCNRTVEAFLLDYNGDLYGRDLKLEFVARLRDEKKFNNVEDLKKQVAEDIRRGSDILDSESGKQV